MSAGRLALMAVLAGLISGALAGCGAVQNESKESAAKTLTLGDLAHRRWVLKTIDDEPVSGNPLGAHGKGLTPELDFGEQPHVAGYAGCNRYKGQAELTPEGQFKVARLATTMMMCPEASMALEQRFTALLEAGAQLHIDGPQLTLTQGDERWSFKSADWVQ